MFGWREGDSVRCPGGVWGILCDVRVACKTLRAVFCRVKHSVRCEIPRKGRVRHSVRCFFIARSALHGTPRGGPRASFSQRAQCFTRHLRGGGCRPLSCRPAARCSTRCDRSARGIACDVVPHEAFRAMRPWHERHSVRCDSAARGIACVVPKSHGMPLAAKRRCIRGALSGEGSRGPSFGSVCRGVGLRGQGILRFFSGRRGPRILRALM